MSGIVQVWADGQLERGASPADVDRRRGVLEALLRSPELLDVLARASTYDGGEGDDERRAPCPECAEGMAHRLSCGRAALLRTVVPGELRRQIEMAHSEALVRWARARIAAVEIDGRVWNLRGIAQDWDWAEDEAREVNAQLDRVRSVDSKVEWRVTLNERSGALEVEVIPV